MIQLQDFDLTTEINLAKSNNNNMGAMVSFVGTVRDLDNEPIQKMTLEHYPGMTEKALEAIANKAKQRWDLGGITIIHRVGDLQVNEQIVLVITVSKHRKTAFESCEFIIDYLKTSAPFWKKEHSKHQSNWVEAKISDATQTNKWR